MLVNVEPLIRDIFVAIRKRLKAQIRMQGKSYIEINNLIKKVNEEK